MVKAGLCIALGMTAGAGVAAAWAADVQEPVKPAEWRLLERIAAERGFGAEFAAVPEHLANMVRSYDETLGGARLQRVARGLAEPWSVPGTAREFRDGLAATFGARTGADLPALLAQITGWLDVAAAPPSELLAQMDALWARITPADEASAPQQEELLGLLSAYVALAHAELEASLAAFAPEERARLLGAFPDWCEAFYRVHFPGGEITAAQSALIEQYKALAPRVERARLLAVAERIARLAAPEFLTGLPKRLARTTRSGAEVEGFSGDVVAVVGDSPTTRTVLLGRGKTTVSGRAALVVDLGGDDLWERAAVVDGEDTLVSVVIELGGNDRYVSDAPGPAYSAGGVALLVDVRGRDEYQNARLGQGATALGFAALVDLEGDDHYAAQDYAQGYAFAGVGLLLDRAGDDHYEAWAYAQGAGNGNGFSALADGGGDDRYRANGTWPDVYGDSGPGSFHGAAQGYSFGFRDGETLLPGGIAVLADLGDGVDEYESGNFSQGGAYFFGFGLMYDGGGDDVNRGYRYSQGFGVHQAVGMRWDAGGNDSYQTLCAANCGAAWDEGVGWLLDESGDDRYEVGGLALGGTANTAVAVLVDLGGDDHYGGGGGADSQGGSGSSDYHQKQAIGALLDLGGGKDSYARAGRADGTILTGDWYGIFVDAKERSAAALLASRELERLLGAR
jgi:hypothetical protein